MLKGDIEQVLNNYKMAMNENFTGHPIAKVLRVNFPKDLEKVIGEPNKYKITGSAGQGNWTYSPWVAIFDKRITKSAQSGFYPVYLFKEDMSGVYLSLNQGATDLRNKFKNKANAVLKERSDDFRTKLNSLTQIHEDLLESIDLSVENSPNAPFYESGNIYAKYYNLNDLPSEEKLDSDLKGILNLYDLLLENYKHLTIIENKKGIEKNQAKFLEIFKKRTDKIIKSKAGFLGGQKEGNFYWSQDLGIWFYPRKIDNSRYWNSFGTQEPKKGKNYAITCEINFPIEGIKRGIAGAFAKDESGNIYMIHRGKLGGNFSKVFFEVTGNAGSSAAETSIRIKGDAMRVKRIGEGMSAGKIEIEGSAGMHVGTGMKGGEIENIANTNPCSSK